MDRTALATHAGHDESLIVRFYGDDVDDAERALALDLMADCRECADLFADLGAIAAASSALPVPTRPRDFTLNEKDAARLRSERRTWRPAILGAGLRRSLGGSLAALGLVGVLMTGAVSLLGGASSASTLAGNVALTDTQGSAPEVANGAAPPSSRPADLAVASPVSASMAPVTAPLATAVGDTTSGSAAGKNASAQPPIVVPAPSKDFQFGPASQGSVSTDGGWSSGNQTSSSNEPSQSGIDARLVWLIGFGVLFALGIAILVLPRILRRRRRSARL
jgi:anti-sigma factor RsiW